MPVLPRRTHPAWWQRTGWSVLVLVVVVAVLGGITVALARDVTDVLPEVGKDEQGEDPWTDPVAIEKVGVFQLVHIPDCALSPVERITLWDEDSKPYWEVSGPAISLNDFAIGATPPGFVVETPFRKPPANAVLRLAVSRSVGGVAGVRYRTSDLRAGYVVSGNPISRYQPERFQKGSVCGDGEGEGADDATIDGLTTTIPGAVGAPTTTTTVAGG